MARRKRGKLTEEDLEIWSQVAKTASPLRKAAPKPADKPKKLRDFAPARGDVPPLPPFPTFPTLPLKPLKRIGGSNRPAPKISFDLAPDPMKAAEAPGHLMDRKHYDRLRRGNLKPEAKLDLHGMTADQAHGVLNGFIMRSASQGKRLVLVITGKGKPPSDDGIMPGRMGVLRHNLPFWLNAPHLSRLILEITPAHQKHGGGGAYYVYLRRQR